MNIVLMIVLVVFLIGAVLLLAAIVAGMLEKHKSGHRPDQRGMGAGPKKAGSKGRRKH